jgi:Bacterial cell division membrane protein
MSLVFFATGGLFGLGYGESIHKYMNFPNPSNDFILPVIVEELGFVFGFLIILLLYTMILFPIVYYSIKAQFTASKIVLIGTFLYFVVHFILNVGGVSGFVPLTGVPLLLISSGGSSWISSLMALGLCQSEIIRNRIYDENNSGQI